MRLRPKSDDELLTAVPTDPVAFATLYDSYFRPVVGYFVNRTGDPELAADLAAETFAAVLEGASRYNPEIAPARAWIFGIAHRKLVDSLRRGQVDARVRQRLGMPRLEMTDADLERIQQCRDDVDVMALMASLPIDQREAIFGHVIAEREYSALARDLRCSEAVVRQRVSRGLRTLRQLLGGLA